MDHILPGSSVHGILQERILECLAIFFSRGSSRPRGRTRVSCIGRQILKWHRTWDLNDEEEKDTSSRGKVSSCGWKSDCRGLCGGQECGPGSEGTFLRQEPRSVSRVQWGEPSPGGRTKSQACRAGCATAISSHGTPREAFSRKWCNLVGVFQISGFFVEHRSSKPLTYEPSNFELSKIRTRACVSDRVS